MGDRERGADSKEALPIVPWSELKVAPPETLFVGSRTPRRQIPRRSTKSSLRLAVVIMLINVAGALILAHEVVQPPDESTGTIHGVFSQPPGAAIFADGVPVLDADGNPAITPVETLSNLSYGRVYKITLYKPGYLPVSRYVTLDRGRGLARLEFQLSSIRRQSTY